jgi:arylsulfatase A-like enzyme
MTRPSQSYGRPVNARCRAPISTSVAALACLLGAVTPAVLGCKQNPKRPNVILISIDCLNQRQFGGFLTRGDAPNLAGLVKDSLVFRRAYAHAPWTTPSHMSMLTGLYPSQHGRDIPYSLMIRFASGNDRVPAYQTLGNRLEGAGYESVAFVGTGSISAAFGLGQGFSRYKESPRDTPDQSDLAQTLADAQSWLAVRKTGPFFLFLHTYDLHYPLGASRSPIDKAFHLLDIDLGKLLASLREQRLYESSLIILTGDHGSDMLHTEQKCCVHGAGHYEENLRIPLVIKLPGKGATGVRDLLVRHIDILPTVLDVVGLPLGPYRGPGLSILPRLAGGQSAAQVYSFSEADARCAVRLAVVDANYKYIYTPERPYDRMLAQSPLFFDAVCSGHAACSSVPREELYDLRVDPNEQHDLMKGRLSGEAAAALQDLRDRLTAHINLAPAYRHRLTVATAAPASIDESTTEALRSLGYIR